MSQETFERELSRRADDVHAAPLSFDDVRGKAVSIRRRRRAAVAGGVAAVVALVIVVPTILTGSSGPKSDGVDPAPPVPGHTAVLHDGTLTLPDGGTVELDVDNADVTQLALLTDGRIVLAMQDPVAVRVYQPDGTLQQEYPVLMNAITVSAADDAVAWIGGAREGDRGVRVLASGNPEPTVLPGIPAAGEYTGFVDAVLGPDRVLGNGGYGTDTLLTPDGAVDLRTSEPLTVTDVSPDGSLWAVRYDDDSDPQYGCTGLYDPEAQEMIARNCDTALLSFSPDGEHLAGAIGDGGTWGSVDIFDRELNLVRTHEPEAGQSVKTWAWADSDHLLVTVVGSKQAPWQWWLTETAINGDTHTIEGPVEGDVPEGVSEYILSE